jgi:MFS family permease
MADTVPGEPLIRSVPASSAQSVQHYIDLRPVWPDGTTLPSTPMTRMQWVIWSLAAVGKFFEGFVVFMTGVALPLIAREFHIGAAQDGFISGASLLGILIGAVGLGGMSDHFGRKRMFIIEMIIFCAFLVLLILTSSFIPLVICLFGIGLALGCDYPTAHMIISESIPSISRGKLVLAAFGFQSLGALAGTGVGYLVLLFVPTLDAWRWMYATAIIPAIAVTVGRSWPVRPGRERGAAPAASQPAIPFDDPALARRGGAGGRAPRRRAEFCRPVQQPQSSRHDSGVRALVPAGPRHVWHRHLHADDPGGCDRQQGRSRAQR